MKPTIRLASPDTWACTDDLVAGFGPTPKEAYDRWLVDSLRAALKARPAKEQAKPAPAPQVEPPAPRPPVSPAPRAAPKPKPKPLTVKPRPELTPRPLPASGAPSYPESMVQQCHGTAPRREYVPPAGLLAHQRAAAAVQPSLVSMSSSVTPEFNRERD